MITLTWHSGYIAPLPEAAVVWGATRHPLLDHLNRLADTELQQLRLVVGEHCWVVLGETARLPWVSNIQYAAHSIQAPELWLPTRLIPSICPSLLLRHLKSCHQLSPILLWPEPKRIIPLMKQQTLSCSVLAKLQALS